MLSVEVDIPSHRRISYTTEKNMKLKEAALDLIQERRDEAAVVSTAYRQRMTKNYNARPKERNIYKMDLVLRRVMANTKDPADGALGSNWKCPLVIAEVLANGAYRLSRPDGNLVPKT